MNDRQTIAKLQSQLKLANAQLFIERSQVLTAFFTKMNGSISLRNAGKSHVLFGPFNMTKSCALLLLFPLIRDELWLSGKLGNGGRDGAYRMMALIDRNEVYAVFRDYIQYFVKFVMQNNASIYFGEYEIRKLKECLNQHGGDILRAIPTFYRLCKDHKKFSRAVIVNNMVIGFNEFSRDNHKKGLGKGSFSLQMVTKQDDEWVVTGLMHDQMEYAIGWDDDVIEGIRGRHRKAATEKHGYEEFWRWKQYHLWGDRDTDEL